MMQDGNLLGGLVYSVMEIMQNVSFFLNNNVNKNVRFSLFLSNKCGTLPSHEQVLCNLARKPAGWFVEFRTFFLNSVILNHSHREDKDNTINLFFSGKVI